ncbi:hypothetical protein TL16_g07763 [Triparma laevis f. inornata]|uniref:WW domain-containing protein n=1 Tax=Triparma laevis f. inornata TaxID=1714386 RepID=A0A9W7AZH9_9STRA|nr:hypothetical protein TL16_g07763 [Triparma laevis f. inornata]
MSLPPSYSDDGSENGVNCNSAMSTVSDDDRCCTVFEAMEEGLPEWSGVAHRIWLRRGYTYFLKGSTPIFNSNTPSYQVELHGTALSTDFNFYWSILTPSTPSITSSYYSIIDGSEFNPNKYGLRWLSAGGLFQILKIEFKGFEGGAIYVKSGQRVEVRESAFRSNGMEEGDDGGAVYCESMNQISFNRVIFEENAGEDGGALFIKSCGSADLNNVYFKGNDAEENSVMKVESTTIYMGTVWVEGNSVTSDDTGDDNWDSCNLKNIDGWSSTSKSTVRTSGGYGGIKVQSSTVVIDGPFCSPEQGTTAQHIAVCSASFSESYETAGYDTDCADIDIMDFLPEDAPAPSPVTTPSPTHFSDCSQACFDANPFTPCFYTEDCDEGGTLGPGGLGCNAIGHPLCRFCGFGDYWSIICPEDTITSTPTLSPTKSPTKAPSKAPTIAPTSAPTIAPPEVENVKFAKTGTSVFVQFDRPTDMAGFSLDETFPCDFFFADKSDCKVGCTVSEYFGSGAQCSFISTSKIQVKLGQNPSIDTSEVILFENCVGRTLTTGCVGQKLRAENSLSPEVPGTGVTTQMPDESWDIPSPVVKISAPYKIGKCDGVALDATPSLNSLGRDFQSVSWLLTQTFDTATGVGFGAGELEPPIGLVDSVELVNEILSSANANKDLLINLQHQHLRPGITYEFSLVLVNFLERTNVADILVSKVDTYIPQVLIQGAQFSRTILRTEQLNLQADAEFPDVCDDDEAILGSDYSLALSWNVTLMEGAVRDGHDSNFVILDGNSNKRRLKIPKNSFSAGRNYKVTVSASITSDDPDFDSSKVSPSVSNPLFIIVDHSNPVVSIQGGDRMTSVNNDIILDAFNSYDPDAEDRMGENQPVLSFEWTTTEFDTTTIVSSEPRLHYEPQTLKSGEHTFYLVVTSTIRETGTIVTKSSSASTFLMLIDGDDSADGSDGGSSIYIDMPYPEVSILIDQTKVNPSTEEAFLSLNSEVYLVDETVQAPVSYTWVVQGGHDILAGTPGLSMSAIQLSALSPGAQYTISLMAKSAINQFASTQVTIYANAPPSSGSFSISPSSGTSMDTIFTLASMNWADEDLPLTYEFKYLNEDKLVPLVATSYVPQIDSMLPPGTPVRVTASVIDSLGAEANLNALVTVGVKKSPYETLMNDMQLSVEDSVKLMDGESITNTIDVSIKSAGEGTTINEEDSAYMIGRLKFALTAMGMSESSVEQVAGTLTSVTQNSADVPSALSALTLIKEMVAENPKESNTVGLLTDTISSVFARTNPNNMTTIDGMLSRMASALVEEYPPGMSSVFTEADNLQMTSNLFEFASGKSLNISSSGSGNTNFLITNGDVSIAGDKIVKANVIEIDKSAMQGKMGDDASAISDVVSLSLWGYNLELSSGISVVLKATPQSNSSCSFMSPITLTWVHDVCEVKSTTNTTVTCHCPESAIYKPVSLQNRRRADSDNLFHDIGDAFIRAGYVLIEPNDFTTLDQQLGILVVLGAIYLFYSYVTLRAYIRDRMNVKERHEQLLKSHFVEKAVRAMRENFLRIELSHKNSIVGGELERQSSSAEPGGINFSSSGGKTVQGLDVFTNRRPHNKVVFERNSGLSKKFLARTSSLSSFDTEDDADILNFLSTNEDQEPFDDFDNHSATNGSESGQKLSGSADHDNNGNVLSPRNRMMSHMNKMSKYDQAENAALEEQQSKIDRLKRQKLRMFWDGIKKEHEMFAVFGNSTRRKIGSFYLSPTPPTAGGLFMKNFESGDPSNPTASSSKSSSKESITESDRLGRALVNKEQLTIKEREERIQELEEYVNIAHRSTVLLCQLLSFLAMAVFFYEEDESLLSETRWEQIKTADGVTATLLIVENLLEGFVQVLMTAPITFSLVAIFKQLDHAGTAKVLFETRVATDQAKLLHGISQENPVDLRRSIHEVEGLLRIVGKKSRGKKKDVTVVKYTLRLLKTQLANVRAAQKLNDEKHLERKLVEARRTKNPDGLSDLAVLRNIKNQHRVSLQHRSEVEDVLVKLCSLEPVRQALFLKDRRAMNHMHGNFAWAKKSMYKTFIAEKEGYVPDTVAREKVLFFEAIAGIYIFFLTYYLYKHSVKEGQLQTLKAVVSFGIELVVSIAIVSPIFIFVKFVVIPSFVANIVASDVKAAKIEYGKTKLKRRASAITHTRTRISSIKSTLSRGDSLEGGEIGEVGEGVGHKLLSPGKVEMIDLALNGKGKEDTANNPMRMQTATGKTTLKSESGEERWWMNEVPTSEWENERVKHEHDADSEQDPHNWIAHFDDDGNPYYEHGITRKVTYTVPEGFMEDLADDVWESNLDEEGNKYWFNGRSGRTSWSEPADRTGEVHVPRAKHKPKVLEGGGSSGRAERSLFGRELEM